ncbi:hypothetical protein [Streptomyces sp. NPDC046261]|uniref:hypothetical protein n=1 Tax=Streptomyces sp. NPDC046261 TaxID=3157200 RepID=UPI0033D085E6
MERRVMPLVRALDAGGVVVDEPSATAVHDLLADLSGNCPYLVVERTDREPTGQHYIQACLNDDGSYTVEYREGDPGRHFVGHLPAQSSLDGVEPLARIMNDWARGGVEWRRALDWAPLT